MDINLGLIRSAQNMLQATGIKIGLLKLVLEAKIPVVCVWVISVMQVGLWLLSTICIINLLGLSIKSFALSCLVRLQYA